MTKIAIYDLSFINQKLSKNHVRIYLKFQNRIDQFKTECYDKFIRRCYRKATVRLVYMLLLKKQPTFRHGGCFFDVWIFCQSRFAGY